MDQSRNVVANNSRLFISVNDFFEKANAYTRLSRDAELQCAAKMRNGDTTAREQLFQGYLPQVAAHLKRWPARHVTLSLVYSCCQTLEHAIDDFDFLQDNEKFSHRLSWHLRQITARHFAQRQ